MLSRASVHPRKRQREAGRGRGDDLTMSANNDKPGRRRQLIDNIWSLFMRVSLHAFYDFICRSSLENLYNTPACYGMEDTCKAQHLTSREVPESSQEILEATKVRVVSNFQLSAFSFQLSIGIFLVRV